MVFSPRFQGLSCVVSSGPPPKPLQLNGKGENKFQYFITSPIPTYKTFTNRERTFLVTRCSFILRYSQDAIPITIGLSLTSSFSTTLPITSEISEVAPSVVNQTPAMRKHLNINTVRENIFGILI